MSISAAREFIDELMKAFESMYHFDLLPIRYFSGNNLGAVLPQPEQVDLLRSGKSISTPFFFYLLTEQTQ